MALECRLIKKPSSVSNLFDEIPKHPFTYQAKTENFTVTVRGKLARENETHNLTFQPRRFDADSDLHPTVKNCTRGRKSRNLRRITIFTPLLV